MPIKTKTPTSPMYIVAIGASAGGLEALQKLLANLPADIDHIAFLIVQHLSPNYKSMMVQTLSYQTKLKVEEVKNKVNVKKGIIYITPPDFEINIRKKKLYLTKPLPKQGPRPSIDGLLISLAADQQQQSIGIILSGTGSDGSIGMKAIKKAGGITIVQDPKSAKYNSMPLAAIETGMIDFILPIEKIGEQLKLLTGPGKNKPVVQTEDEIIDKGYREIITLLARETGTDFTNYKHNTLFRRITNRLATLNLESTRHYHRYIEKNPAEIEELFNTVLIGVTSFFRDPFVFKALEKTLSRLVDTKTANEAIRVWVPGCATGEEAYTIGILLAALLKKKNRSLPVQIFATDINEHALLVARKGVYHQKALKAMPADILKNYFLRHNGFSEVSKNIRSTILFSKHDLTHNPPFLKLDLIVCRNLLIYFNARLQDYVFPVFYSALVPNGYLLLGKSESIGHFNDHFSTINREAKIFQRKAGTTLRNIRYTPIKPKQPFAEKSQSNDVSITEMVRDTIFKLFEHPYVVINDIMDIQEISGDVSRYIGLKQGQMNANLVKLVHKDLRIEVRTLINKCISDGREAKGGIRSLQEGELVNYVKITVLPLLYSIRPNDFYLVIFEAVKKENNSTQQVNIPHRRNDAGRIKEMEMELAATRDDLQGLVERLENSNTEMQSLNEEMQSTNEELRISNEELETANEELQSTNEEINIAYNELKVANEQLEKQDEMLQQSKAEISAMLGNTLQLFILINKNYKIIAFNKMAAQMMVRHFGIKLVEGEDFHDLLSRKECEIFSNDFKNALRGNIVTGQKLIVDKKGQDFSFIYNFTPVVNDKKIPESISFSLLDITELNKIKHELSQSEKLLETVFHTADIGIVIVNQKGKMIRLNDGLCKLLGYNQQELIGKPYQSIIVPFEKKQALLKQQEYLAGENGNDERKIICSNGKIVDSFITNNLFTDGTGNKFLVKTIRDISESKKYKNLLQQAERTVKMGAYELDVAKNKLIWTDEMYRIYEVNSTFNPVVAKVIHLYEKESRAIVRKLLNDALLFGKNFDTELELITASKNRKWVKATGTVIKADNHIVKLVGTVQDITTRKEVELQLQRLSFVASKTNNAVIITDAGGKTEWVNDSFVRMTGYDVKEILGKATVSVLQGEGTDPAAIRKIKTALKKRLPISQVLRNYRKDGTPFWINMDITPVIKNGRLVNFIGLGVDITALIEAKEAQKEKDTLEQRQQLFNAIATNFPDGIIGVLDKDLNYVFAGGTEIEKFGLTSQHFIGEHIFDSLTDKGNSEAEPLLKKAFARENVSFEQELHGDMYAIHAVPLNSAGEVVTQILVVLNNITNRKKAEQELWQALAKQKQLNELKSKFVSIASHEFRTPLSGILSSAYLISKYSSLNDVEKIQKHTDRISDSVRVLTDIINDFLSLGKMEEGNVSNNPVDFNLVDFCQNLTDEIKTTLVSQQELICQHKGDKDMVTLDKQHLGHILTNLLSNAVKYSPGKKKIWITTTCHMGQTSITIQDEGIGIPEADQPHIFQTFFRANNAVNIQGTGMGLHIVKRYLDIMGGTIEFLSKPGKGTTFTIQFPATERLATP